MGMPNAYKVANEMLKDRLEERNMSDDYEKIINSDIIIVSGTYDHIQNVFSKLDMKFALVTPSKFRSIELNPEQIIFINCPGNIDLQGIRKIKKFVHDGGFLFTTDWALRNIIEPAFPNYIRYNNRPTGDEVVRVEIQYKDDPFLQTLVDSNDDPQWWIEGSSYPIEVINEQEVDILVKSKEVEKKYGESAIFVSFNYGKGKVYHMISHFYLQRAETRTGRHAYSGADYLDEKLASNNLNKSKYEYMVDDDTNLGEIEAAFSSSALMNKVLWDKKNQMENINSYAKE
jgi:hypothetical protein